MNMKTVNYISGWRKSSKVLLFAQIVLFAFLLFYFIISSGDSIPFNHLVNIIENLVAIPVSIVIFISCMRNNLIDRSVYLFMIMMSLETAYLYFEAMANIVDGVSIAAEMNFVTNIGFSLCPVVFAWLFWRFLCSWREDESHLAKALTNAVDIVTLGGISVVIGNVFWNYFFYITDNGYYKRGNLFYISYICPTVILLLGVVFIIKEKMRLSDKIIFLSYPLLPWLGALVDYWYNGPHFMCIALFLSMVFVYSNIFVKKDETLARRQVELAESNMNSMMLQINPHFIYNTLGSISSLCHDNPDQAEEMLQVFSDYLRNNFGEMAKKTMIPIEEELEHLKFYIKIEKLRFPDIEVELDFKALNFKIPSLSVQPLVENAIKHGIMGRETGGTLKISTYEDNKYYYVSVQDDGVGFKALEKNDGKTHIGISNVKKRLEMLCGGQLIINSTVNVGTVSEIRIPKNKEGKL